MKYLLKLKPIINTRNELSDKPKSLKYWHISNKTYVKTLLTLKLINKLVIDNKIKRNEEHIPSSWSKSNLSVELKAYNL